MEERQDAPDFLREVAVELEKVEGTREERRTSLEERTSSTEQRRVRLGTAEAEDGDADGASAPGGRFGSPSWEQQRTSEETSQRSIRGLSFT